MDRVGKKIIEKRILKNILRIWHLPKGDLPKIIIILQPSDKPARGLWYSHQSCFTTIRYRSVLQHE
jgi:hypothetical protein